MKLPDDPPDGLTHAVSPAKIWLAASVYIWATGCTPPGWCGPERRISIRPGETGRVAYERETGERCPDHYFIFYRNH